MGQRCVTHLWAWGPPKSIDALRTRRKESEQASQTHTLPLRDQSHLPSPQRLQGGRGHPSVPEDPPVHGPQALPVAETSWLREQHSSPRHARGKACHRGTGVPSHAHSFTPPTDPHTFSLAPIPVSTCGEMTSDKNRSTREDGLVRTDRATRGCGINEDIGGQWGEVGVSGRDEGTRCVTNRVRRGR